MQVGRPRTEVLSMLGSKSKVEANACYMLFKFLFKSCVNPLCYHCPVSLSLRPHSFSFRLYTAVNIAGTFSFDDYSFTSASPGPQAVCPCSRSFLGVTLAIVSCSQSAMRVFCPNLTDLYTFPRILDGVAFQSVSTPIALLSQLHGLLYHVFGSCPHGR